MSNYKYIYVSKNHMLILKCYFGYIITTSSTGNMFYGKKSVQQMVI